MILLNLLRGVDWDLQSRQSFLLFIYVAQTYFVRRKFPLRIGYAKDKESKEQEKRREKSKD